MESSGVSNSDNQTIFFVCVNFVDLTQIWTHFWQIFRKKYNFSERSKKKSSLVREKIGFVYLVRIQEKKMRIRPIRQFSRRTTYRFGHILNTKLVKIWQMVKSCQKGVIWWKIVKNGVRKYSIGGHLGESKTKKGLVGEVRFKKGGKCCGASPSPFLWLTLPSGLLTSRFKSALSN